MFSYIFSFVSNLFSKTEVEDEDNKDIFLAEQLLELEVENEKEKEESNGQESNECVIPCDKVCFQRTGVITYKSDDDSYVLIDGILYFDITLCSLNLFNNDKVLYLAYKDNEDAIKVVRILENLGMCWGEDDESQEESCFKLIEHDIVGEVLDRSGRLVFIKDSDLQFSLDEVAANFVPIKGDWLELSCSVQWDDVKPSVISPAQVVKVLSLKPLRSKIKNVTVTSWNKESGTCDRVIYFDKYSLPNGQEPTVGCKVLADIIESNQGTCTWRILKLAFLEFKRIEHAIEKPIVEDLFEVEKEKQIHVTYPLKFDEVHFNHSERLTLNITNNSEQVYILNKWIMLSKKRDSQLEINPFLNKPMKLFPKQTLHFTITCNPKFIGNTKECLIVMFRGFQVKRFIQINVVDNLNVCSMNNFQLKERTGLIETMRNVRKNESTGFVPGVRPVKPPAFVPVKLNVFKIPDKVWSAVLGDSDQTMYNHDFNKIINRIENNLPCLMQNLTINNYIDRWHTLLYLEEVQANISMRSYDMPKAFMITCQDYLGLEIKGLSERRPSLIAGDRVVAKDMWDSNIPQYEGYIHEIKGELVLMKFNPQFQETYSGSDVAIEFHFSRTTYRRAHQAISLALSNLGPDVLFPCRSIVRQPQIGKDQLGEIKWFNKNLNEGQKSAVTNILSGECRPLPYIIFGPPGTGKTVTVTETILQILTLLPESRILVASPSNSGSNLVAERLINYKKEFSGSIIRLIANHLIDSDSLPDLIKPYCATLDIAREETNKSRYTVNKNGINLNCQMSFIGRHRVTIGTCSCIGTLAQMGFPRGHFTHVIVDEAGQATEPEIMIPLTFIDKENGQIILAGDPKQLGPVILSNYCKEFGMDQSYLERILETFPYQLDFAAYKDGYNNKLVSKLIDNYRSLSEVLSLPSEMFYNSSLVPKLDRTLPWIGEMLKTISEIFSIHNDSSSGGIFVYGIRGCNERALDSPSWYNPQEASMVALTACKLYKKNVRVEDMGIISPYIAQIRYLNHVFDAMGLPKPKIGTVEEFQGQERAVILITTVRSTGSLLAEDIKHTLGFIRNPKRLNVAITRAQVAVLLFCDPHILSTDKLWSQVISEAVNNDKYLGCDLPLRYQTISCNKDD